MDIEVNKLYSALKPKVIARDATMGNSKTRIKSAGDTKSSGGISLTSLSNKGKKLQCTRCNKWITKRNLNKHQKGNGCSAFKTLNSLTIEEIIIGFNTTTTAAADDVSAIINNTSVVVVEDDQEEEEDRLFYCYCRTLWSTFNDDKEEIILCSNKRECAGHKVYHSNCLGYELAVDRNKNALFSEWECPLCILQNEIDDEFEFADQYI